MPGREGRRPHWSGIDLAREPRAGVDPGAVPAAAPALVDVEGCVGDGLLPAPPEEVVTHDALLPRVPPSDRVVAEPARTDDRGCAAVGDRVGRVVRQPGLVDPERVPVGVETRVRAAVEVLPRARHVPGRRGAGAEGAERTDVVVQLDDHVVHATVLGDRRDGVCTAATVLTIDAVAARPVGVALCGLTVGPAEEDRPGHRAASDGAARVRELVVGGLVRRGSCPEVVPGHDEAPSPMRPFAGTNRVGACSGTMKNGRCSTSPLAYVRVTVKLVSRTDTSASGVSCSRGGSGCGLSSADTRPAAGPSIVKSPSPRSSTVCVSPERSPSPYVSVSLSVSHRGAARSTSEARCRRYESAYPLVSSFQERHPDAVGRFSRVALIRVLSVASPSSLSVPPTVEAAPCGSFFGSSAGRPSSFGGIVPRWPTRLPALSCPA